MLPLARDFTVIAVDPRGVGLSDKRGDGYDSDSLSADMFALMDALGHDRFLMVGHDVGMWTAYAMVADRPERFEKIALGEAIIPGVSPSPPLMSDDQKTNDFLSHFNFNRMHGLNERLVEGREDIFFGFHLSGKAAPGAFPAYARDFYIEQLRRVPGALKASFEYYRAIGTSMPQNRKRRERKIKVPVLAFAGDLACGDLVENELRSVADDVQAITFTGCGHYVPEEKPEELLAALRAFFGVEP